MPPPEQRRELFQQVRASQLYDRKLKMYKVNASLEDQPHHIGRARAFTPGWLENESIWLHMAYKYLLEVLKAGLYDEFFEDFELALIPFLDPNVYRRSPLENTSFLVSSAHPDESLHGAGFVARLSGSTAEFLSIWQIMMAGQAPFILEHGELHLKFAPILPGWLFTTSGRLLLISWGAAVSPIITLAGWTPTAAALSPHKYILHTQDGSTTEIQAEDPGCVLRSSGPQRTGQAHGCISGTRRFDHDKTTKNLALYRRGRHFPVRKPASQQLSLLSRWSMKPG